MEGWKRWIVNGTCADLVIPRAGCGKTPFAEERRPPGLKPALIPNAFRDPEGPLFRGDLYIRGFFRSLLAEPNGQ
jgi:hypothetical protein